MAKTYRTIRKAAEALLLDVSYVDVYGRNIGLTYNAILKKLHEMQLNGRLTGSLHRDPQQKPSRSSLRMVATTLNSSGAKMPVRRSSVRVLARDYARALLIHVEPDGTGLPYQRIARKVKAKFPEAPYLSREQLIRMGVYLEYSKQFKLPPREK